MDWLPHNCTIRVSHAGYRFLSGPQNVALRDVRERMEIFKPGGGFIFSQVHNIQADVPPENVVAMLDAAYEFGVY